MSAIVDVTLVDGSETSDKKKAELAFTLFYRCDNKGDLPADLGNLLSESGQPLAMFSLISSLKDGSLNVNADESQFFFLRAEEKRSDLTSAKVAELQSLSDDMKARVSNTNIWQPR